MKVAAVILAAGASVRLGTPKQLIRIGGETLLERAARACREAGCEPVAIVLGAAAEQVRGACSLGDAMVVFNESWKDGMATSISKGIRCIPPDVDGCIVTTCDMPSVSAEHLRKLAGTGEITSSAYAGRRGVPAYFPRLIFRQLLELQGDSGARSLLQQSPSIELPGGELDIDTPEDLQRAMGLFC